MKLEYKIGKLGIKEEDKVEFNVEDIEMTVDMSCKEFAESIGQSKDIIKMFVDLIKDSQIKELL